MAEKKTVHVYLSGRVQGVGFRAFIRRNAERLSVQGWARNLADGRVEALFSGDKSDVDQLLKLVRKGPRFADVQDIKIEEKDYQDKYSSFEIRF